MSTLRFRSSDVQLSAALILKLRKITNLSISDIRTRACSGAPLLVIIPFENEPRCGWPGCCAHAFRRTTIMRIVLNQETWLSPNAKAPSQKKENRSSTKIAHSSRCFTTIPDLVTVVRDVAAGHLRCLESVAKPFDTEPK